LCPDLVSGSRRQAAIAVRVNIRARNSYLMEECNSYPGIYLELVCELYRDIADRYSVTRCVQRVEIGVIRNRTSREGLSFLTKALPRLGKAVDTALSKGTSLSIIGFKTDDCAIPKFLGWLLSKVFDSAGRELVHPDPIALKHFRQLVYVVYKLEMPNAKETEQSVLTAFVDVDASLPSPGEDPILNRSGDSLDLGRGVLLSDEWISTARALVARVVSPLDHTEIKPRHGPGAVATGESVLEKSNFSRIYTSLERVYPFTEYMMFNLEHVAMSIPAKNPKISLVDEPTAKVVLVPKDSRGPRLISCEPLEVQTAS
jgi:hypothetical protein